MTAQAPAPALLRRLLLDLEDGARTVQAMLGAEARKKGTEVGTRVAYARAMLAARERLSRYVVGAPFADPAFDMLLDLFVAAEEGEVRTVKSVTVASRVAGSTALRWISVLADAGLVERSGDPLDGRRTLISISEKARRGIDRWIIDAPDCGKSPRSIVSAT